MTDEEEGWSEEIEEVEVEDVPLGFDSKTQRFMPVMDFYAAAGTDPFYFAGAATKIKEELGKYVKGGGGIGVTLPASIGSSISGFRTITRPTGTKRGWSQAPDTDEEMSSKYRLIDFVDDEVTDNIRKFVRYVLTRENPGDL